MSKSFEELAVELTSQIVKSKGEIIASVDHNPSRKNLGEEWLSDEAVSKTYMTILKTIKEN